MALWEMSFTDRLDYALQNDFGVTLMFVVFVASNKFAVVYPAESGYRYLVLKSSSSLGSRDITICPLVFFNQSFAFIVYFQIEDALEQAFTAFYDADGRLIQADWKQSVIEEGSATSDDRLLPSNRDTYSRDHMFNEWVFDDLGTVCYVFRKEVIDDDLWDWVNLRGVKFDIKEYHERAIVEGALGFDFWWQVNKDEEVSVQPHPAGNKAIVFAHSSDTGAIRVLTEI